MNHLLSIDQFDFVKAERLLDRADALMAMPEPKLRKLHRGRVIANLFYEPSTRTSSSFHAAISRMGGSVISINDVQYSSVSKGENLEDTIRTLGCYADAIVLRHPEVGAAKRAAAVSSVPIINAGDGVGEHPTQALLDLHTIRHEQCGVSGKVVGLMGDLKHGRTVHSLTKLLRHYGAKLIFISPDELRMPREYVRANEDVEMADLLSCIWELDVLYVTRVQKERFTSGEPKYSYSLNLADLLLAKNNLTIMHPLPRVDEIDRRIDGDPRAAYFRQMRYGMFTRMAVLDEILSAR